MPTVAFYQVDQSFIMLFQLIPDLFQLVFQIFDLVFENGLFLFRLIRDRHDRKAAANSAKAHSTPVAHAITVAGVSRVSATRTESSTCSRTLSIRPCSIFSWHLYSSFQKFMVDFIWHSSVIHASSECRIAGMSTDCMVEQLYVVLFCRNWGRHKIHLDLPHCLSLHRV